jgi:hypothetical protein
MKHYLIFIALNNLIFFYYVSICNLYKWRYKRLGNLAHVENWPEYRVANPGFWFDFQLTNVEDFNGVGESEPSPYFYQVGIRVIVCLNHSTLGNVEFLTL